MGVIIIWIWLIDECTCVNMVESFVPIWNKVQMIGTWTFNVNGLAFGC